MPNPTSESKPFLRSYGRRKARKLRPAKAKLVDEVFARYLFTLQEGGVMTPSSLLPGKSSYRLEIGFGDGGHLAYQAKQHPEVGFIGAEPFLNGVAALVEKAEEDSLGNIRVFHDDVRLLLQALPDRSLERVDILFPDPWPKARHKKRRLVQPALIDMMARIIKPNGLLRLASDDTDYITWMLLCLKDHPEFSWTANEAKDWKEPPVDWIQTKYQKKAAGEGRYSTFLEYRRV
ncbi:MAG: tRNA (guanosine(46)-N7)-methyltransferase TrmB [Rickettsiales bacterium]